MKIEEKFEHILKNSIHIQNPDNVNTIGWFYPNESELRHKKLCELMNRKYEVNLDNYDLMFNQNIKNDTFWLHYDKIWSVFYNEKGWNYDEVQVFTQERLEQHLKRKGVTTRHRRLDHRRKVGTTLKKKGSHNRITTIILCQQVGTTLKKKGSHNNIHTMGFSIKVGTTLKKKGSNK